MSSTIFIIAAGVTKPHFNGFRPGMDAKPGKRPIVRPGALLTAVFGLSSMGIDLFTWGTQSGLHFALCLWLRCSLLASMSH